MFFFLKINIVALNYKEYTLLTELKLNIYNNNFLFKGNTNLNLIIQ